MKVVCTKDDRKILKALVCRIDVVNREADCDNEIMPTGHSNVVVDDKKEECGILDVSNEKNGSYAFEPNEEAYIEDPTATTYELYLLPLYPQRAFDILYFGRFWVNHE